MKKDTTKKTKKRQPTKSQLPSSSVKKKPTPKTAIVKKTTKKPTIKSAKKPVRAKSTKPKTATKKPIPKKPASSRPKSLNSSKTKKLNFKIPFTHQTVTISIQQTKKSSKKKSRKSSKKPAFFKRSSKFLPIAKIRKFHIDLPLLFVGFGLFGTIYFGLEIIASAAPAPTQNLIETSLQIKNELTEDAPKTLPSSMATKLQIPSIGVDTALESIGKNPDGTIVVPSDYKIAGSYNLAPTPGELGPAIIVGHVDNYRGPGVFWHLSRVKVGSTIFVSRQDGGVAQFRVDSVTSFSQDDFPTQKVYGNINYAGLRLITCGGSFNILTQRYSENTVVFASLIEDTVPEEKTTLDDFELSNSAIFDSL